MIPKLTLLLGPSALCLVACTGKVDSTPGPADGGSLPGITAQPTTDAQPDEDSGKVLRDAAGALDSTSTPVDSGPASSVLIVAVDGGVGGLCAAGDGGDAGGPSDASAAAGACGCTRRPGAGSSFQCPAGLGEATRATIGPAGGTVSLEGLQGKASGVQAELQLPPTAVSAPTTITLIETAIPPPSDLLDWSPVYLAEPAGLALVARTPVQFPWSNASGTAQGLAIWSSPDGVCFTRVPDSYTNAGFEQGSTTQLGYFIVGAPRTPSAASCP